MKKLSLPILFIGLLFCSCKSTQKTATSPSTPTTPVQPHFEEVDIDEEELLEDSEDPIFEIVEEMPQFPGGQSALANYLRINIKYPAVDKNENTEGTSYVQFVVNRIGQISDVHILQGTESRGTETMHSEAIRVVSNMPNWVPGKQGGKHVSVKSLLPIKFTLR